MTLPRPAAPDPFGLWDSAGDIPARADEAVSFGLDSLGEGAGRLETPAAMVWRIGGKADLEARTDRVEALNLGLSEAQKRLATMMERQAQAAGPAAEHLSFEIRAPSPVVVDSPEAHLLSVLEKEDSAQGAVSFGILDRWQKGPDWQGLQSQLDQFVGFVNRQLLHFAWVDTEVNGLLVARTTINWGGDMTSVWLPRITSEQTALHRRSLQLAIQSRQQSVRTVSMTARMAGQLALAFTTPLGPLQWMALAWQFISDVVSPRL